MTGLTTGHKNTIYEYSVNSTDEDDDTINYIFRWGNEESIITDFLPFGTNDTVNHSWSAAGRYIIEVQATDNDIYSRTAELIVMIDAVDVRDLGYLTDYDGDETYDVFHNSPSDVQTVLGLDDDGKYLIDNNGDDSWDYIYDIDTSELVEYIFEDDTVQDDTYIPLLVIILTIFVITFFVLLKIKFFLKSLNGINVSIELVLSVFWQEFQMEKEIKICLLKDFLNVCFCFLFHIQSLLFLFLIHQDLHNQLSTSENHLSNKLYRDYNL